jgi:pimeloyl-ACP methyl ester carboxylesterase
MTSPQPLLELGGAGTLLHVMPANGFPPETYIPLLRPFLSQYRAVSLPPRALWLGEQPPTEARTWDRLADDLLDGLRDHNLPPVIAIGHSFGGVASLLAAAREPERFRALCLLDATIFPAHGMAMMAQMQVEGTISQLPLVQGAARRRRTFESIDEAYVYFKGKSLFRNWPDETIRLYAEFGTRPMADGSGRELAWSPEWEVYYFSTAYTDTWDVLPQLRGKLPILTIRGGESDTLLPEAAEKMRAILPEMAYAEIPGQGHMFPQSAPQETAAVIGKWLEAIE